MSQTLNPTAFDSEGEMQTRTIDEILSDVADAVIAARAFTTAASSIVQAFHSEGPQRHRVSTGEKMMALEKVLESTQAALNAAWRAIDCKVAEQEAA